MSPASDVLPLVLAVAFVVLAGAFASAEVALSRISRIRVEELVEEGVAGAPRLLKLLEDAARPVNIVLLLRLVCEVAAVAVITRYTLDRLEGDAGLAVAIAVMAVVHYVFVGVSPRTLGRQHAERMALLSAGPVGLLTSVLSPLASLLILVGNALTPGKGFREGPFASEAELRDLVERANARGVVEQSERDMIQS
ncbi:MAG: CNNM domain-containing protein, partial [Mycobacteriales bacterium]